MVMTLGLATVSSSAAYSDAADVSLNEAVDVMSAVGVFQGADGKFSPKANLTREQAAKLIAYLDLGESTAEALPALKVFDDVAADRWSAKYIAYCADAGYIAGDGTGKFNPAGELTGYAFGKMVLCVLGYDAEYEQFVGNNWTIKVAKLMEKNNIADGIDTAASATLTREQAAQYCLNALQADMVEYLTKPTTIAGTGLTVTTGGSSATAVPDAGETALTDFARKVGASTITKQQLVEKLYASTSLTLYKDNASVNGKDGYTWKTSKNGKIESAASFVVDETTIGSSYDATAVWAATGKSLTRKDNTNSKYVAQVDWTTAGTTYKAYINGAEVTGYLAAAGGMTAGNYYFDTTARTIKVATGAAAWTDVNGNGVLVELIDTDNNTENAEKVYFTTYTTSVVNKAPVVKTLSTDGKDYIFVDFKTGADIGTSAVNTVKASAVKGYEGLAKDDVVTWIAWADGTYEITKAESSVGVATAISGTTLTIDGTSVKAAANADATITTYAQGFGNQVTFYKDAYGYNVRAEKVTESSSNYLLVTSVGDFTTGIGDTGNKAAVVFDDGTTGTISVNKAAGKTWGNGLAAADVPANKVYSYVKNDDGTYNLTEKTTTGVTAITKGVPAMTGGAGAKGDSTTIYIVKPTGKTSYTVYNGYANAPTLTGATAYVYSGADGNADRVFVTAGTATAATTKDLVYLLGTTFTTVYDEDGAIDYYTLSAIVNGEKTTVKTSVNTLVKTTGLSDNADNSAADKENLYAATFSDGKLGAASLVVAGDGTAFANNQFYVLATTPGIKAAENGVVAVTNDGGTSYTSYNYTDDCKVFVISDDDSEVEVTDITGYDDSATYGKITLVTKQYGDTTLEAVKQNTIVAIYLQK